MPTFFVDQVQDRMCANGQVVERREIDEGGHTAAAVPAYDLAVPWLQERFAEGADGVADSCTS